MPIKRTNTSETSYIVVVDPMSTGATLAYHAQHTQGLRIICVWSDACPAELRGHSKHGVEYAGVVIHETGGIKATCAAIRKIGEPRDVFCGSEPGVELADELSEALKLRGAGDPSMSETRRNKFLQSMAARKAGLPVAAQKLAKTLEEVDQFLVAERATLHITGSFMAVVKPCDGAGSEGVTVCKSEEQVRETFQALQGTVNVLGRTNREVLLMEFLAGDEYVVDTMSRDGVHKCVCIWKYIKFPLNGAENVFYGQRLMSIDAEPHLAQMVQYVIQVITALGIVNGAVHNEVKYNGETEAGRARGAVMIESNCRLHGAEGSWKPIAERCLGYSHVSTLLDAYDPSPDKFNDLPKVPENLKAYGAQVGVRSVVEGTISHIKEDKVARIRLVNSYDSESLDWANQLAVGQKISKTIDILTLCGQIQLVHKDKSALETDLAKVQEIIDDGLFVVEKGKTAKPRRRKVTGDLHITPAVSPAAAALEVWQPYLRGYVVAFGLGVAATMLLNARKR